MNLPVRERSSEGVIDLESRRPKSIEISVKTDKNYRALSKKGKSDFWRFWEENEKLFNEHNKFDEKDSFPLMHTLEVEFQNFKDNFFKGVYDNYILTEDHEE